MAESPFFVIENAVLMRQRVGIFGRAKSEGQMPAASRDRWISALEFSSPFFLSSHRCESQELLFPFLTIGQFPKLWRWQFWSGARQIDLASNGEPGGALEANSSAGRCPMPFPPPA